MISSNVFNTGERSPKGITPYSPQAKRKNLDFTVHTPLPTPTAEYVRKEVSNGALSPHGHLYTQKLQPTTIDASTERDYNIQILVRDLSDRVKKISQKLGQHESILIKMTQNSIENNKQQCRKGGQGKIDLAKITDAVNESVNKLRRQFEEYRSSQLHTRQVQIKSQLFSELIHKSEERMRDQIQAVIRKINQSSARNASNCSEDKLEDYEKVIRKMEKAIALNSGKINAAYEKIESISSSIDGHMDLVNAEVNKAIAKIVGFVNQKVSKPITENVELLSKRIDAIQTDVKSASPTIWHFGGLRASSLKSGQQKTKAEYRQTLTAYDSQIIISQNTYYIDRQGYLLDSEHYYLLDSRSERIRLDERQIAVLTSQR